MVGCLPHLLGGVYEIPPAGAGIHKQAFVVPTPDCSNGQ